MLVQVSMYSVEEKCREMSEEKYAKLRQDFPMLGLKEDKNAWQYISNIILDGEQLEILINQYGLEPTIQRIKGLKYTKHSDESLDKHDVAGVRITQISVANNALLNIDTVTWLEDACTEQLQQYLDDSWRILAVCPPNDSRRPTYILGRKEKTSMVATEF